MPAGWPEEDRESGVDLAFDAMMHLEENSDLAAFMRNYMETSDGGVTGVTGVWQLNKCGQEVQVETNRWTERVLRGAVQGEGRARGAVQGEGRARMQEPNR